MVFSGVDFSLFVLDLCGYLTPLVPHATFVFLSVNFLSCIKGFCLSPNDILWVILDVWMILDFSYIFMFFLTFILGFL